MANEYPTIDFLKDATHKYNKYNDYVVRLAEVTNGSFVLDDNSDVADIIDVLFTALEIIYDDKIHLISEIIVNQDLYNDEYFSGVSVRTGGHIFDIKDINDLYDALRDIHECPDIQWHDEYVVCRV